MVENTGQSPLEFTTALHSYFKISAIEKVGSMLSRCWPQIEIALIKNGCIEFIDVR